MMPARDHEVITINKLDSVNLVHTGDDDGITEMVSHDQHTPRQLGSTAKKGRSPRVSWRKDEQRGNGRVLRRTSR